MSVSKIAGLVLSSAALVAGHGYVSGAVVDGQYYGGFLVDKYSYMDDPPEVIGWSEDATDLGFVDGSSYSDADIICHKNAKTAGVSAAVKAGGKVELQWTDWPESHHGPVITYLANCNGDCSSVDKTALEFFKIDEAGLINGENAPGTWASDNLISNNNSYTVTVPSSIAAGNYVLRHEIIALHSAGESNGAQNYPQCLNLKVTGGGSDSPSGTVGTKLYTNTDPGIKIGIYQSLSSYTIPGPALYTGAASSGSATSAPASSSASATAAPSSSTETDGSVDPASSPSVSSDASEISQVPDSSGPPRPSYTRRPIGSGPSSGSIPSFTPTSGPSHTVTSTPLAQATDDPTPTSQPAAQTASTGPEVSVTASPSGQSAQGSSQAQGDGSAPRATASAVPSSGSGSDSGSSSSGSSSGSASESDVSSYNSDDWTSYLDSLNGEQALGLLRQTLKWLVTDKKHARDMTH